MLLAKMALPCGRAASPPRESMPARVQQVRPLARLRKMISQKV